MILVMPTPSTCIVVQCKICSTCMPCFEVSKYSKEVSFSMMLFAGVVNFALIPNGQNLINDSRACSALFRIPYHKAVTQHIKDGLSGLRLCISSIRTAKFMGLSKTLYNFKIEKTLEGTVKPVFSSKWRSRLDWRRPS